MRLAWTVDDAPTIASSADVDADPLRMDRVRETLLARGVRHCVAFVIGKHAEGQESILERWLEAGYELGNHTHEHVRASHVGPDDVIRSAERCDRLLRSVGAFDGGRDLWFRFPHLDRGPDPESRRRAEAGLRELGYRLAHASLDTIDHCYEAPLRRALASEDVRLVRRVQARYLRCVYWSTRLAVRAGRRLAGRPIAHAGYGHFGLVGERFAGTMLDALAADGVRLISLAEAMSDAVYTDYEENTNRSGLVTAGGWALVERILRRAVRFAAKQGWSGRGPAGPLLPFLHEDCKP